MQTEYWGGGGGGGDFSYDKLSPFSLDFPFKYLKVNIMSGIFGKDKIWESKLQHSDSFTLHAILNPAFIFIHNYFLR